MHKIKSIRSIILLLAVLVTTSSLAKSNSEIKVKSGESIAFMGDSITAAGTRKNGYAKLVIDAFKKEGLDVKLIAAGKSGNKSNNMLARLDQSVLSKKPDWMTLSCGVNDVWHYTLKLGNRTFEGIPLDEYKKNIRAIVDQAEKANIKVVLLTSTMIGEDPEKDTNKKLIPYNAFLRDLAKEKNLPLADLNKDMQEALKKIPDVAGKAKMFGDPSYQRNIKNKLTSDGCHMNKAGNIMMAKGVLKAFGMSDSKIASAEKSWLGK